MLLLFVLVVFTSSFVLAAVAVVAASHILERKQGREGGASQGFEFGDPAGILKTDQVSSITIWGNLLNQFDFVEGMRARLAEADMSWSVGRLTALMLLIGAFTLASVSSWLPFWIALLLACGAAAGP